MCSLVYICKAVKRRQEKGKEVKGRTKQRYKRKIRRKKWKRNGEKKEKNVTEETEMGQRRQRNKKEGRK